MMQQQEYFQALIEQNLQSPSKFLQETVLKASWIETKLGPMLAIGDDCHLYLLEFVGRSGLEQEILKLSLSRSAEVVPGSSDAIISIREELEQYFAGKLKNFQTPFVCSGTPFQMKVWEALQKIPFGTTWSYGELACKIAKPAAFRAVAQANGTNQLAVIIPCHRVINGNGKLGGYSGGVANKEWLLQHERYYFNHEV